MINKSEAFNMVADYIYNVWRLYGAFYGTSSSDAVTALDQKIKDLNHTISFMDITND